MAVWQGVRPLSDSSDVVCEATETIAPYLAVKLSSAHATDGHPLVALTSAVTSLVYGITQNSHESVADDEMVDVRTSGWSYATAGGTVAYGDPLVAGSDGRLSAAAPSAGVNNFICGWCLSAGTVGQIIAIQIKSYMMQGA